MDTAVISTLIKERKMNYLLGLALLRIPNPRAGLGGIDTAHWAECRSSVGVKVLVFVPHIEFQDR